MYDSAKIMKKNATFSSQRLQFRSIQEMDADNIVQWRSDPEIIRYFRKPYPLTKKNHLEWYKSYCQDRTRYDFLIIEKKHGQAIGVVGGSRIDWKNCSCELSYLIGERAYRHKGYAIEAVTALMIEFSKRGISNFFAEIHEKNANSIHLITKLGFVPIKREVPFIVYCNRGACTIDSVRSTNLTICTDIFDLERGNDV